MKRIAFLLVAVATTAAVLASTVPAAGPVDESTPIFVTRIPSGYRDWRFISVAHEEGSLHSFAAILGNDVAIKAFREGKLPYPDGAIVAALHYSHIASEENNKVFGNPQSSSLARRRTFSSWSRTPKVRGDGRLGFGHFFTDGKPAMKQ